jgi:hypothetical protein
LNFFFRRLRDAFEKCREGEGEKFLFRASKRLEMESSI